MKLAALLFEQQGRWIAVVPLPGMPSVSSGTMAPPVSALLAPSGAATPSIAPWPNSCGCLDTAFSMP